MYREAYNLKYWRIFPSFPSFFLLPGFGLRPTLTTSPYLTDSVFDSEDPKQMSDYLDNGIELCQRLGAKYLLVKTRIPSHRAVLEKRFNIPDAYVTTILNLEPGEDGVWKRVHSKVRNQIRKGLASSPILEWGREDKIADFYEVFARTQTELGTPVHSKRLFSAILRHHPAARFVVAYHDARPVAGALTLIHHQVLYHPYAGTLKAYRRTSVNNVLYWEMIKYGIANGCTVFDMGRSFVDSGNAMYKRSWGGNEVPLFYAYFLNGNSRPPDLTSRRFKVLTTLWRAMPVGLAEVIGPPLIKRVP